MPESVSIVWFRIGDLRLHDHEPLVEATLTSNDVLPVWIQPKIYKSRQIGLPSIGLHRLRVVYKALESVSESLTARGAEKLLALPNETALQELLRLVAPKYPRVVLHYYTSHSSASVDRGMYEQEERVVDVVNGFENVEVRPCWGKTLWHPHDISGIPDCDRSGFVDDSVRDVIRRAGTVTAFREAFQGLVPVRSVMDAPRKIQTSRLLVDRIEQYMPRRYLVSIDQLLVDAETSVYNILKDVEGSLPCVDVTHSSPERNREASNLAVTELEALDRLEQIVHDENFMGGYRESRMATYVGHHSALLSVALSLGSLSPRQVYRAAWNCVRNTNDTQEWSHKIDKSSPGHIWLLMHLAIRDYFLFMAEIDDESLCMKSGPADADVNWSCDAEKFDAWVSGKTGFPFVDASMRQIQCSGFMSNRSRQNAASFLTKELGIDWRWGAEYFAYILIDHEPGINLESWAYISGVGNDPRNRKFMTVTQGERYDPEATLIRFWIPELAMLSTPQECHRPWEHPDVDSSYVSPIVPPENQIGKKKK